MNEAPRLIEKSNTFTFKNDLWTSPFGVFTVFAIGIILPAGLLGYLGFKSFQYERIVLSNQTEQRFAAVADSTRTNADNFLLGLVDSLRVVSEAEAFQRWNVPAIITQLFGTPTLKNFSINEFFVFDEQDQLVVPPLFSRRDLDVKAISSDVDWGMLRGEVDRLSKLELAENKTREALDGYLALQKQPLPDPLQATLLKYTASCLKKLNDNRAAESAYLDLIKRFDQTSDPVGYPEGIVGRQLLADLYEAEWQNEKSIFMRLDLMEGLLLGQWPLFLAQEQLLTSKTEIDIVRQISAPDGTDRLRWARLKSLQARLGSLRNSAQKFLKTEWPEVIQRGREQGWLDKGGTFLIGKDWIVVTPILNATTHHRQGLLVATLDAPVVQKAIDSILLSQSQPLNLRIEWEMSPSSQTSRSGLERSLVTVSPPLMFKLLTPASDAQSNFLRRRMHTYAGMIGLSSFVIVIGLVVMFESIRRAKENADLKAEFVTNISHELRTPLTAISYIGERLRSGRYRTSEEVQQFYSMLGEETTHLQELIEDILDFSKVMGGKKVYVRAPASLRSIVEDAYDRFNIKAKAQGFSVSLKVPEDSVLMDIDAKALRQAILNLLDNALKYSGESRDIELHLEVTSEQAIVSVRDFGIGIDPDEKEKIFEKFYRIGQGEARDAQGVGLGLAMVKHIIEAHGGHVAFISAMHKGTTFLLTLPRDDQQ